MGTELGAALVFVGMLYVLYVANAEKRNSKCVGGGAGYRRIHIVNISWLAQGVWEVMILYERRVMYNPWTV